MDDRYEIRNKIGQGGIGSVYKGYDKLLNRDVAIKRIVADRTKELEDEATRQMTKEISALGKLQHPNIVTVYDAGVDQDGPFVVMELLPGKTVDEVVAKAPMTWPDFREFAMQIHEALIAAQDMELVHRDLKPTNVMLIWLPSGRFQVKIVDFGLAKFTSAPSLQTIDLRDSIFGSIYFMAPEQFERIEMDARADMYSIGCVFYYALTGKNPFHGETGPQVMLSHLEHRLYPLQDVRPDLPQWAVDWVMWHINRLPEHRPSNAREAMSFFLQSEKSSFSPHSDHTSSHVQTSPNTPDPENAVPAPPENPALKISAPQAIHPPEDFGKPSVHTDAHTVSASTQAEAAASPTTPAPPPVQKVPASAPAFEMKRSATAPAGKAATSALLKVNSVVPTQALVPQGASTKTADPKVNQALHQAIQAKKPGMNSSQLTMIAVILTIVVAITAVTLYVQISGNKENKRYNEMLLSVKDNNSLEVTSKDLDVLLKNAASIGDKSARETLLKALYIAKSKDGTDVEKRLSEYTTETAMSEDIRRDLISRVISPRKSANTLPALFKYAKNNVNTESAAVAMEAIRTFVAIEHFPDLMDIFQSTTNSNVRKYSEEALTHILSITDDKKDISEKIAAAYETTTHPENKMVLIRLLGGTGSAKAKEVVMAQFTKSEKIMHVAAADACRNWPNDDIFMEFIEITDRDFDQRVRAKMIESATEFLTKSTIKRDDATAQKFWNELIKRADNVEIQMAIIKALAKVQTKWSIEHLKKYVDTSDDQKVSTYALRALNELESKMDQ